jgi:TetR/AcrR family transcriptional repressor of bet genes
MAGLDANFDETLFTSTTCSIWLQFWANAPYHEGLARLQRINRMRVTSHFRAELRHLLPANRLATVQQALQNYMDGVWLEAAMNSGPVNAQAARREARRVADLLLKGG